MPDAKNGRHDSQQNDTRHNDIWQTDRLTFSTNTLRITPSIYIQHRSTCHNDTHHNDSQHKNTQYNNTQHTVQYVHQIDTIKLIIRSVVILNVIMLTVKC